MKKYLPLILLFLVCTMSAYGHVIDYEFDKIKTHVVFWNCLVTGYKHIIPEGYDHILFIMCVFFLNTSIKKIVLQASMFTLAHSITLGLALYGVIKPPVNVVEPLIALSIVFLALENVFSNKVKPWRLLMVFLFGMVHGMGFAAGLSDALTQMGAPKQAFATALVAFNIGVELGQVTIILIMYYGLAHMFGKKPWYRKRIVIPASLVIAAIAGFWTVQRVVIAVNAKNEKVVTYNSSTLIERKKEVVYCL